MSNAVVIVECCPFILSAFLVAVNESKEERSVNGAGGDVRALYLTDRVRRKYFRFFVLKLVLYWMVWRFEVNATAAERGGGVGWRGGQRDYVFLM